MSSNGFRVQAVVFDWAGTAVDYGCLAPIGVFVDVFARRGVDVTPAEVRRFMGLPKREHVRALLRTDAVRRQWLERFDSEPDARDLDELYADFEPLLVSALPNFTEPIPGVVGLVGRLRAMGMRIGSCTGYTEEMMDVVAPRAAEKGFEPDVVVTPDYVPAGRPAPFMCYENAIRLAVYPLDTMVKVGDTVADIKEGRNAGAWSVGVVLGGNELGLNQQETLALPPEELEAKASQVEERLFRAGAHYVIRAIGHFEEVLEAINRRLAAGDRAAACAFGRGV